MSSSSSPVTRVGLGHEHAPPRGGRRLIIGGIEILTRRDSSLTAMAMFCCTPSPTPSWEQLPSAISASGSRHDPKYHGADSSLFIREAAAAVRERGWEIGNLELHRLRPAPPSSARIRNRWPSGSPRCWELPPTA